MRIAHHTMSPDMTRRVSALLACIVLMAGGCGKSKLSSAMGKLIPPEARSDASAAVEKLGITDVATREQIVARLNEAARALDNLTAPDPEAMDKLFQNAVSQEGHPESAKMIGMVLAIGEKNRLDCGVSEADRIKELDRVLTAVVSADPAKLTPQMREAFAKSGFDMTPSKVTVRKDATILAREAKAIYDHQKNWQLAPENAVRAAADLYMKSKPGTTRYQSLRTMVAALREAFPNPKTKEMRLRGEPLPVVPAGLAPCPKADPKWSVKNKTEYWDDPTWCRLWALKDSQLPGGAINEAVSLLAVSLAPIGAIEREGYRETPTNLAQQMVIRYGARALPSVYAALCNADVVAKSVGGKGSWLVDRVKWIAENAPTEQSLILYRSALEAGWVQWEYRMPETPQHKALLEEFKDSPYGHWWQD